MLKGELDFYQKSLWTGQGTIPREVVPALWKRVGVDNGKNISMILDDF